MRLRSRAGNEVTGGYPELAQVDDRRRRRPARRRGGGVRRVGPAQLRPAAGAHARARAGAVARARHAGGRSWCSTCCTSATRRCWRGVRRPAGAARGAGARRARPGRCRRRSPARARRCSPRRKQAGLEGVVAKRRDSTYLPGRRSDDWVKVKHLRRQSAVVIGWKAGEGGRSGQLGSLLLAVQGRSGLVFAGHVGTGFTQAALRQVGGLLRRARGGRAGVRGAARARPGRPLGAARAGRRGGVHRVDAGRAGCGTRRTRGCATTCRPSDVVREQP